MGINDDDDDDDDDDGGEGDDEKNLEREDVGLAAIVYKHYARENIKTVDAKGNGFEWIEKKKIWERQAPTYLRNRIPHILEPIIKRFEEKYSSRRAATSDEGEEAMVSARLKKLKGLRRRILQFDTTRGILGVLLSKTRDEEFETRLNKIPHLLPIKGGRVLNLKTLEVRERTREDFFSFELSVDYATDCTPEGKREDSHVYPNASKFFAEICRGDVALTQHVQRLLGYCMTGETSERSLFICWGKGMNGKSTVINIMKAILGRMYCAIDEKVLMAQERKGGATPELIPLMWARLAVFAESENGEKLNSKRVKLLTGDDDISARALYGDQITFRPYSKLVMLTNNKPVFDIFDDAMQDRVKLIPFLARFPSPGTPEGRKNKEYVMKMLSDHLDEVFAWIAEGAYEWYRAGLPTCGVIKEEMDKYVGELDVLSHFIDECCEVGDDENYFRVGASQIYDAFGIWCNKKNSRKWGGQELSKALKKKGFTYKKSNGKRMYVGLKLLGGCF